MRWYGHLSRAHGARRGMAKKRGGPVTSRDLRGGAASLSLGRRRSTRSVHRARRLHSSSSSAFSARLGLTRDDRRYATFFASLKGTSGRENREPGESRGQFSKNFRDGSVVDLLRTEVTETSSAIIRGDTSNESRSRSREFRFGGEEFFLYLSFLDCAMTLWI